MTQPKRSPVYTCVHCGDTRPGLSHKKWCDDRDACIVAKKEDQRQRNRDRYAPVKDANNMTHIEKMDAFIPQVEALANQTEPAGSKKHAGEADKARWDCAFHSEMNRLTIAAGLRVEICVDGR